MNRWGVCLLISVSLLLAGCGGGGGGGGTAATPTPTPTATATATATPTPTPFAVTSSDITNGTRIATVHTGDGSNTSPQLTWSNPPSGTVAYALLMRDFTVDTVHWLVVNIPSSTTNLARGASPNGLPSGAIELPNEVEIPVQSRHLGPFPPSGEGNHTYRYIIYALNDNDLRNNTGYNATSARNTMRDVLVSAIITGTATIEVTYSR